MLDGMWEDIKRSWTSGSMLYRLIWLNVVVFVLVNAALIITKFGGVELSVGIEDCFGLATTSDVDVLMRRPWSVFTHMFAHTDILHLIFNMILLWWMGSLYQAEVGSRRLLSTYLTGGLAGFVFYILAFNFLPGLKSQITPDTVPFALGSSAAVLSIFTAAATLNPNRKVRFILFGSVQLKYIALAYVLFDYFGLSQGDGVNDGGKIAHLGGALFGYMLVTLGRKGINLAGWLEVVLDFIMSRLPSKGKSRSKLTFWRNNNWKKKAGSNSTSRVPKSDAEFNLEKQENTKRLDLILEKISRHGYDHLTKEEKQFLFNQSNR
jgi:membrane associated rhomboid family serine protease